MIGRGIIRTADWTDGDGIKGDGTGDGTGSPSSGTQLWGKKNVLKNSESVG